MNSSRSMISRYFPVTWALLFSPPSKTLQLPYHDCAHIQGQAVKGQRVRKQWLKEKNKPTLLGSKKKGCACGLQGAGAGENGVEKRGYFLHSLWVLGDTFLLLSQNQRAFLSALFAPMSTSEFRLPRVRITVRF